MQLIECVPNISEGRDPAKIKAITDMVETVEGVRLLDVDPGRSTHRTVITFVGPPDAVCEAAFRLVRKAAELIDMRLHKGEHPRMGATDVCPLVPVSGITLDECAALAQKLGERIGRELGIPVYLYERAAHLPERKNLAHCRKGEYEGLEKIALTEWTPDFGPARFDDSVRRTGVTAVGARDFLVAYNVNLNTTSTRRANAIAFDIREAGRNATDPATGKNLLDPAGLPIRIPGTLPSVKGIGWYIEEYGIAQLSLNLTDINVTPVHIAFEEAVKKAAERGVRVTGSEIVGLIPLRVLTDAADHFLRLQERSLGISDGEKVKIAIRSLGLSDIVPFRPEEKVIEYLIADPATVRLTGMTLRAFAAETASESPAPGGGSIAAYCGALGISLGTMVANLSAHKRGWDERWEEFSQSAERGQALQKQLLAAVDEDTRAFNRIMDAFGLPKGNAEEKTTRKAAIQAATRYAMEVPLSVARLALESMAVLKEMTLRGNPNSITDAGVGALCARTAVLGAVMNVKINASGLDDKAFVTTTLAECRQLSEAAEDAEKEIRELVEKAIQ